jgi:rhamnose utilization protein RhaD (predicted bifunctional aldolase and dehydrogenase)/NAD(P)-dependent dehydrogenase (short-subunit alcohol dehydrogenase family)
MKNGWSDGDEMALRVYSARLLGGDPKLVLHGGGNASLKTTATDLLGEECEVLRIKGSGWDMATLEPAGFPAVRLAPLRKLMDRDALSDVDMVNAMRGNLLDSTAPDPSVEILLHAFLPHRYVDHTHANAVLALTNQPDGEALCAEVFKGRAAIVPYVMSGLALAKAAFAVYRDNPAVEGLILLRHGIVTFGDTARQSYERMIDLVSLAEARIAKADRKVFPSVSLPERIATAAQVAPILRGLTAVTMDEDEGIHEPFILNFRATPRVLEFVNGDEVDRYACQGTATPDHVIRTKRKPLILPAPEADHLEAFTAAAEEAITRYTDDYNAYFQRNDERSTQVNLELDPLPRVILVRGLGLFGLGRTARDATIAADLAESNVAVISDAESVGRFESISEADAFDLEYWSLEQAKLGHDSRNILSGHVVMVTGGASGIGAATAELFAQNGAQVAVLDLSEEAATTVAKRFGGLGLACDVTDADAVRAAFDRVCAAFGGVDIVVSNAGNAWQGEIGTVSEEVLRTSFELNFWAHQRVAQNAVRIMRAQGLGGCLLFNVSKQAVNPGLRFGPYGLPKAATLFLVRQYAVDHGADGIRANGLNADRIRSGLLSDDMVASRSTARGLSEREYMSGNLLGLEVTAWDVAQTFIDLALARKTTGAIATVDGGNIAAALR